MSPPGTARENGVMGLEILGITLFVLLIGASIALHEIGHLVPAKKFGVRVTDYMVGFGPTIWSKVKGETRYGLKAFPVGGYIRMIGMLPPGKEDPDGTARSMNTGRFAAMMAQARQQSLEEVRVGDENRLFYKLPVRKRVIIMLGGPVMNLVLAFLLFGVVLVGIGIPAPTTAVNSVVPCTPTVALPAGDALPSGQCPSGTSATPAAAADHWVEAEDVFAHYRVDEQLMKALDRKVWLPSGGSLVIDRTEAMTVVDVNTGKFTGSGGNLEQTVTKNNLEAAEEIVRQLRLLEQEALIGAAPTSSEHQLLRRCDDRYPVHHRRHVHLHVLDLDPRLPPIGAGRRPGVEHPDDPRRHQVGRGDVEDRPQRTP